MVRIDRPGGRSHASLVPDRVDDQQRGPFDQGLVWRAADLAHDTRDRGSDDVLHLHRFHDGNLLAALDGFADADVDADHCSRNRCADGLRAFRQRLVGNRYRAKIALAVRQDCERINRTGFAGRGTCVRRPAVQLRMLPRHTQHREIVFDESDMPFPVDKIGRGKQVEQKLAVAGNARDPKL
jgi:hypothetical protein